MASERKAITRKVAVDCLLARMAVYHLHLLCPECRDILVAGQRIEFDHVHGLLAGGPDEYQNLRPMHYTCHQAKTKRDVALNAKAKRIARGPKPRKGPKMKSRGFDKTKSRKFGGTVTARVR